MISLLESFFPLKFIKRIVKLAEESEISCLEISTWFGLRQLVINKKYRQHCQTDKKSTIAADDEFYGMVYAPAKGRFYFHDAPFFSNSNCLVKQGQLLGRIIKGRNTTDVLACDTGMIISVMVKNGSKVSSGRPLFLIEKK
ncbi:MAG: hypothetical protein WCV50_00330 [Patescibacteria group bacterium]|jgi:biotin carboxyl carrier protein